MTFSALLATADGVVQDHLGDAVTYTPGEGAAVEVSGIFDLLYQHVDLGQAGVSSSGPAVFILLSDLDPLDPETDEDARITVEGSTYKITEVQKDGKGGVRLLLMKTS